MLFRILECLYLDRLFVLVAVVSAALSGCGGGGGGGGGGGNGSETNSSTTGVRVLHAAIDAAPIDVFVGGVTGAVSNKAVFGVDNGYHSLPSGQLNISLTRASTPSVVVGTAAVSSNSESRFSILLYGDNSTFGLRTTLLTDESPADPENARLRIVDGVTAAAEISADISSGVFEDSTQVGFGKASKYLSVPPGVVSIRVNRSADGRAIAATTATLEAGREYTYLVAGEVQFYAKGLLLQDK
jgi:hypothetical protein